jgi:hypothetical protein
MHASCDSKEAQSLNLFWRWGRNTINFDRNLESGTWNLDPHIPILGRDYSMMLITVRLPTVAR